MDQIYVYFSDMPSSVKALTVACDDGYTIYLNSRNSYDQNIVSYCHELDHIRRGDFSRVLNVSRLEYVRHAAWG